MLRNVCHFCIFSIYYRNIITHKSFNIDAFQIKTGMKISVPADGREGSLVISGEDVGKLVEARHHVHSVIDNIRCSHQPMQFLSIPIRSAEIEENFKKFKVSR